LKVWII